MVVHPNRPGRNQVPRPFPPIFLERVRYGVLAANKLPILKLGMDQYLLSVGKTFSDVVTHNPRLNTVVGLNFRLGRQLACYSQEDPASSWFPPPTNIHHSLSWCDRPGRNPKIVGHSIPGLDRILLPDDSRRILSRSHRKLLHTFPTPRHPVLCQRHTFTRPHCGPLHLSHRILPRPPLHHPEEQRQRKSVRHSKTVHPRACAVVAGIKLVTQL